jgi:hypothetical protein
MLSKKEYEEQIEKNPKPILGKRKNYEEYVKEYKENEEKIKKLLNK